jgi:hypothetical protein
MAEVIEFQTIPATSRPRIELVQREVHRALMPECGVPVLSGPCPQTAEPCPQTAELGKFRCYPEFRTDSRATA